MHRAKMRANIKYILKFKKCIAEFYLFFKCKKYLLMNRSAYIVIQASSITKKFIKNEKKKICTL